jgi:hypothetical protein
VVGLGVTATVTIKFVRCACCSKPVFVREWPRTAPICPSCFKWAREAIARLCWK